MKNSDDKGAIKGVTKGKLGRFLETFMTTFGVLSYIVLGKTKDSWKIRINRSIGILKSKQYFMSFLQARNAVSNQGIF